MARSGLEQTQLHLQYDTDRCLYVSIGHLSSLCLSPTTFYRYAPAYERFGSQINAIHFIGPNKPWDSLLYRVPGSSSADHRTDQADRPSQTYDHDSLVDKWYAVYDQHYRLGPADPAPDFDVKRYTSEWDKGTAEGSSTRITARSGTPLDLGDLRRIAVEGMSTAGVLGIAPEERRTGDGEYRSLPLEGRVDLMRPRLEEPVEEIPKSTFTPPKSAPPVLEASIVHQNVPSGTERSGPPSTPPPPTITWRITVPDNDSPIRMHTLPTPAPHELPDTPHLHTLSLPPSMPPTPSPLPRHSAPKASETRSQQLPLPQTAPPTTDDSRKGIPESIAKYLQSVDEHARREEQQQRHLQPYSQDQDQQPPLDHSPARRPASPPLVVWNPAVEPPPTDTPPASTFLADTYFQNVWDRSPGEAYYPEGHPWTSPPPDTTSFFEEPAPSEIPEQLVVQGHYINVTGEQEAGATPSPDRKKVKRIFPWEDRPRQLPRRQFPTSEPPLPGTFIEPSSPPPTAMDVLGTPERQIARGPIPSPLSGLPSTLNYANVWDSVPSIQRYASRLVRPSPPALLAPPFEVGRRRRADTFRSRSERTEVSSRDGDNEDNADESETGDENQSQQSLGWTKDSDSEQGTYRRRGSMSPRSPKFRKEYVSVGVQTVEREMRSQEVQVDHTTAPTSTSLRDQPRGKANGDHPIRPVSSSTSSPMIGLGLTAEPEVTSTPITKATKTTLQSPSITFSTGFHSPTTSPIRSPVLPYVSMMPKPPAHTDTPPRPIPHVVPGSSTRTLDSPSIASPLSSIGPLSPPEGMPIPLPPRKGGRVWDPARGVELLRRGSEEVLTRFLKMGSREDDYAAAHHGPQH